METVLQHFPLLVGNLGVLIIFMCAGWIISLIIKDASLADKMWGLGFILVAWLTFAQTDGFILRKYIICLLTTIWGLRLFLHITWRSRGKGEDPRYSAMRDKHGNSFWIISLFKVFIIQALFLWVISFVIQYGQISAAPERITVLDITGLIIWSIGFLFESIGDYQLARFIQDQTNKGKIMNRGLWKYTRHPNYFGESTIWWGMFIMVLSTPGGVITVISPILITYTLLRISGVTLMEKTIFGDSKEYQEYIKNTSSFIPWFPGRG